MPRTYAIIVPEMDLGVPIALSTWLVRRGTHVRAGMPVAELLCGPATWDLSSPVDGRLTRKLAAEGDQVLPGQAVAEVESIDESDSPTISAA